MELTQKGNEVEVDPSFLFQRLCAILLSGRHEDIDLSQLLSFELCPYPAALAQSLKSLNKSNKPALVERLAYLSLKSTDSIGTKPVEYVIDGGFLL